MPSSPPTQSAYFPPLDKCLAGTERLISWRAAYRALCDSDATTTNNTLQTFLADQESHKFLSNALDPYLQPGSKTKSDFETKTAPIHVAQSSNGDYNVDELKKDALWLSEQVGVEELVALRCVLLEWQQRAEEQLLASLAAAGTGAVGGADLGVSMLGTSTASFGASILGNTAIDDFTKEEPRRMRQLQLYLDERSYLLKIAVELVTRAATRDETAKRRTSWVDDVATRLVEDMCSPTNTTTYETFLTKCIGSVDTAIKSLEDAAKVPRIFTADDAKQEMYMSAVFTDMTTTLRLLLASLHLAPSNYIPDAKVVQAWYKLVGDVGFFSNLTPSLAVPDPSTIQALASLISISVLRLPAAIVRIQDNASKLLGAEVVSSIENSTGGVQYPDLSQASGTVPYYENRSVLGDINSTLYRAAKTPLPLASPAIFAWSLLTSNIRDIAKLLQEAREQRRVEEGAGQSSPSLTRRTSTEDLSDFEKQYLKLQDLDSDDDARDDPPGYLARMAVDGMGVFGVVSQLSSMAASIWEAETAFVARSATFDLVQEGLAMVSYSADVLEAVLSIIAPSSPSTVNREGTKQDPDRRLADRCRESDDMQRAILSQAMARYPFELSPLLRLLTALSTATSKQADGCADMVTMLEDVPSLTLMVDEWFRDYQLENEDENENMIQITEDLPLFISKQYERGFFSEGAPKAITMGSNESGSAANVLTIPAGAHGIVIKETRPLVLRLGHPHSALEYLGLLLSTSLPTSELLPAPPMDANLDRSTTADIVSLINALLTASLRQQDGVSEARHLLGRLSNAFPEGHDIISVNSDIMETELLAHLDQTASDGSLDLLVACAEFANLLVSISPDRVWSSLQRSSLLGLVGGANALAAVVAGSEVPSGSFRFLAACVQLYGRLVDDAIAGLVKRRPKINKKMGRFDSPMLDQDVTPERTIGAVLVAMQGAMGDVWTGMSEWRFGNRGERLSVGMMLAEAFEMLVKAAYGIGEGKRVSALLEPAAKLAVEGLASGAGAKTCARVFGEGVGVEEGPERSGVVAQTEVVARFLTTLLRTSRMLDAGRGGSKGAEKLGRQLVKLMPVFAALMATDAAYKRCVSLLLAEVVQAINVTDTTANRPTEPPSLLGQMSADAGKHFLAVLSHLDRPLRDLDTESSIWSFLAAVMASRQQWFAVYLLTGSLPRTRLKEPTATDSKKSLLSHALDELSDLVSIAPGRTIAMLKFVAAAQNAWVWASSQVREHDTFLKNAVEWLSTLQAPSKKGNTAEELLSASELRTAAYLCEILAVGVHAGAEVGDRTVLKLLLPKLQFLREYGVVVDVYNHSLHGNLDANFKNKYGDVGIEVADFKRTNANTAPDGRDFEYDVDFADHLLGHETAWHGASVNARGGRQGFKEEFARANVNLSLVAAQRELLAAWRLLATTMSECLGSGTEQEDATLGTELAKVVEGCLRANAQADLNVPGMDGVVEMRAAMAFTILSKLIALRSENEGMKGLLGAAWDAVVACPVNYDVATSDADMLQYRTVLQVLYLAIQPHAYMSGDATAGRANGSSATDETKIIFLDPAVAGILIGIVARVIAPGFRALCGNLHTSINMAQPADFALLTAILRASVSVKGIEAIHPQIADTVATSSLVRGALSLYSWSDRLAETMSDPDTPQDPIYGELALLFLLALSTVPAISEQMALTGLLTQLASANLSNYFRKPAGKGPWDEPRRMFVIWTEGFLPLCLNLLDAVGAPVAADVSTFLNGFRPQLARAEMALENRVPSARHPHAGAVTLGLVKEASSLCLIAQLLKVMVAYAADAGIDANDIPALDFDAAKVREEAVGLVRQRTSLASRVVPVGEREEGWARMGSTGADNVLLAKVVGEIEGLMGWEGDDGMV